MDLSNLAIFSRRSTCSRLSSRLFVLTSIAALVGAPVSASSVEPSAVVAFGDSLSDNGNLHAATAYPPAPYFEGRFSNGPVWVEGLVEELDLASQQLIDFAVGGATSGRDNVAVPEAGGLLDQIDRFVALELPADPNRLYVVWIGANDLMVPGVNPEEAIGTAMQNIATAMTALVQSGATRILVPNLPNLGRVPEIIETGEATVIEGAAMLTVGFNRALDATLDGIETALPVEIVRFDVFAVLEEVVADPGAAGFDNVTERCLAVDLTSLCEEADGHLFWDGIHPSAAGHRLLAERAKDVVCPEPVFLRADANSDGAVDQADAVTVLSWLFLGGEVPACHAAADANGDASIDVSDATYVLNHLYLGGRAPAAPFPECGPSDSASDAAYGCAATACE